MTPEFKLAETPLQKGSTLLEASAGTGKTYTITGLVLRLLVEQNLTIDQILVVTFTDAATKELTSRIREGIREACEVFRTGTTDNPMLQVWLDAPDSGQHRKKLDLALASFDEARIHTILGFCNRILREYSVDTGYPPEAEILTNPQELWLQLARDYWRNEIYPLPALEIAAAACHELAPDAIVENYSRLNRAGRCELRPTCSQELLMKAREHLHDAYGRLLDLAKSTSSEALLGLLPVEAFKKDFQTIIPDIATNWDRLGKDQVSPAIVSSVQKLSAEAVESSRNKRKKGYDAVAQHEIFHTCSAFYEALLTYRMQMRMDAQRFLASHHRKRKDSQNHITYDDLLMLLHQSLQSNRGPLIRSRIQEAIKAALIDEFQDTDPLQYEVFSKLFFSPEHYLFLIGDPKQAIYGFRGADIFSYLQAKKLANYSYTLSTNWRSSKAMIDGVNALFSGSEHPFVFEEIEFHDAHAAEKNLEPQLWFENDARDGLEVVYQQSPDGKPINNDLAKSSIMEGMVGEIARLLSGKARYKDRGLNPEDIAVLTRTNYEALSVREALLAEGIPAVVHSEASVFEQAEAGEMLQWMNCVIHGGRSTWIKGLLIGSWFNYGIEYIASLDEADCQILHDLNLEFRELRELWLKNGFLSAFIAFQKKHSLKPRLLSFAGGDRKWTNLFQLADLSNQFDRQSGSDPHAVLRWFCQRIQNPKAEGEDHLVRLEKDENAVTIMTMHKSKGLQFPVVFCPYLWSSGRKDNTLCYHDPKDTGKVILELSGGDSEAQEQCRREDMADKVRLFYVALTRAQCKTYLFWGDYKTQGLDAWSAIHVNADTAEAPEDRLARQWESWAQSPPPGIQWSSLDDFLERPHVSYQKHGETYPQLASQEFQGRITHSFRISSFSALSSGLEHDQHYAFEDEAMQAALVETDSGDETDIFHLPGGTRTGDWFHGVMERISFESDDLWPKIMQEEFDRIKMEPRWLPVMDNQIRALMRSSLPADEASDSGFCLSDIPDRGLLREAPFHLNTPNLDTEKLIEVLDLHLPDFLKKNRDWYAMLPATRLQGFLKGFIDMVAFHNNRFYLLDWKSNQLGKFAEAYDPEHLPAAMCHSAYPLQYLIYTVALVRFLKQRMTDFDYDKHFGGVLYIFIRGIDPDTPGRGCYFHKPSSSLIEALDQCFSHE